MWREALPNGLSEEGRSQEGLSSGLDSQKLCSILLALFIQHFLACNDPSVRK